MPFTIVLHPTGEEAIVGEVENLPHPEDISIMVTNPRRLDGKELHYLVENVITVIWPLARLNFIE
ncbi:MAG: hypothetical protein A2030_11760, partial [Chloroflexi bacterium RBG_19FT_COMBO_50_10]